MGAGLRGAEEGYHRQRERQGQRPEVGGLGWVKCAGVRGWEERTLGGQERQWPVTQGFGSLKEEPGCLPSSQNPLEHLNIAVM